MRRRSSSPGEIAIWPAFTDVLGSMLVVLVFLITVFVINEVLIGREMASKETAIDQLQSATDLLDRLLGDANAEKAALTEEVSTLQQNLADQRLLIQQIRTDLAAAEQDRSQLQQQFTITAIERDTLQQSLDQQQQAYTTLQQQTAVERDTLQQRLDQQQQAYTTLQQQSAAEHDLLQQQAALLSSRSERLAAELARLNSALGLRDAAIDTLQQQLDERSATISEQQLQISQLDARLKRQLVQRVEELERYKSDFFGRLREVFANNPDIKVSGDRFVFQSEVLFPSGAAELSTPGKGGLNQFVEVYRQVESQIPPDLPVIIEVQGHTDRVPIRTARFSSNWELSSARALNVVDYLISQGVPPQRLAAVGMGEYHPLDNSDSSEALRRNRRIELKISSR